MTRISSDVTAPRRTFLRTLATTLTVTAALLASATVTAQTILADDIAPFEASYSVGNDLVTAGRASLSLTRNGDGWAYSLSTRPTGVFKLAGKGRIREISVIDVVPTAEGEQTVQLQARSYSYRQDEEHRRSVDATFDWADGALVWRRRGKEGSVTFEQPVFDRLSVTLAVMSGLRNGFETLELEVFDKDRIKTMRFTNEGTETLDTRLGAVETIRVRGENVAGSSRSSLTWFAPSLDFVPVRLEQHKRDELVARLTLRRLQNRVTDIDLEDTPPDAATPGD